MLFHILVPQGFDSNPGLAPGPGLIMLVVTDEGEAVKRKLRTGMEESEVMVEVAVGVIIIQMNAKFGGKE